MDLSSAMASGDRCFQSCARPFSSRRCGKRRRAQDCECAVLRKSWGIRLPIFLISQSLTWLIRQRMIAGNAPSPSATACSNQGFFLMQRWRPQPLERSYKGYTISGSADRVYRRVACSDRWETNPTKSANLPSGKEDSKSEVTDRNSMCSRSARPPQS